VSSNQIHQGGKISSAKKRQDFIEWLDTMEHGVFKIPRPNIVLYLSLPLQVALRLIDKRAGKMKREYLKKKKDVHENDVMFLQNSRRAALWLTKTQKNWMKIECLQNGQLARPEVIHEEIYKIVKKIIKK
jgi:dTMP kinase